MAQTNPGFFKESSCRDHLFGEATNYRRHWEATMKISLLPTLVRLAISIALPSIAQDAMKVVTADELVWKEHPVLKGAQTVILVGDPTKAETIVQRGVMLKPGSVFVLPANHTHHTWTTDEEVILQIYFTGPGGITFLDPADDPRNKAQ
jgi:hypothetical protein